MDIPTYPYRTSNAGEAESFESEGPPTSHSAWSLVMKFMLRD